MASKSRRTVRVICKHCGKPLVLILQHEEGWGPGPCLASEWTSDGDYEGSGTCDYPS